MKLEIVLKVSQILLEQSLFLVIQRILTYHLVRLMSKYDKIRLIRKHERLQGEIG